MSKSGARMRAHRLPMARTVPISVQRTVAPTGRQLKPIPGKLSDVTGRPRLEHGRGVAQGLRPLTQNPDGLHRQNRTEHPLGEHDTV